MKIIVIALAGMGGALSRYYLSGWISSLSEGNFPYGTMVVNIIGSFLIGFAVVLLMERFAVDPVWRSAVMIGFLGSFTTFATFELETLNLLQNGQINLALLNILGSVILGLAAVFSGAMLAKLI